ncbi:site-specific integrase [Candidatus Atribacteria bacterium 1244-E10-H5-B2]|nr:MAG: site-specific integrase [Candidatus Atribacteria bacterium 1244-E10-H5-B2]
MHTVEPIKNILKILAIKRKLKEESNSRNYLLFTAGVNLALRISDLLSLKVKDVIDSKGDILTYLHIKEGKTGRPAKIYINNTVKDALFYYLNKSKGIDPDSYLFKSERSDKKLDRVRAWGLIQKWVKAVGLEGERYGTHTLRKTWGYQARRQGLSIEQISEKLGHKSVTVTRRYIGISQEEINQIEKEVEI